MKRLSLISTFLVFLSFSIYSAPVVWVIDGLSRVRPDDPAGSSTSVELFAARGEYESFQVVVKANGGNLSNVNATVTDLKGPGTITKSNYTLYREHYVNLDRITPGATATTSLGTGWYPDPLIPFVNPSTGADLTGAKYDAVPFSLTSGKNQPIWIDVFVPRDALSGKYTGTLTVTSDQGNVAVNITLNVWKFALPLKPYLDSYFPVYQSHSREVYIETLKHRLMPLVRSTLVGVERELIDNWGLSANNLDYMSGAVVSNCSMNEPPSVTVLQSAVSKNQKDIKIWNYTADEISACTNLYDPLKRWYANLHQAGAKQLVVMIPTSQLYGYVDMWVILPNQYADPDVQPTLKRGDPVWSYNCMYQDSYSPKWQIDFRPIEYRIQPGFINQCLGLSGLLYWCIDVWAPDPWNNVYSWQNAYPGDGMLVYPGADAGLSGVVPSMRLKQLRDGVDDYDYIEILKKAGRADYALTTARQVGPDWKNWTRDPNVLYANRKLLGDAIDKMNNGVSFLIPTVAISVGLSSAFGYKARYENNTGSAAAISFPKKPAWISTTGDSMYGKVPGVMGVDTVIAVVSAAGKADTLRLKITAAFNCHLEAESGTLTAPMSVLGDASASGGKSITAPGTSYTIFPKVEASYTVNLPLTGPYYVFLRAFAPSIAGATNYGTFIGFNGTPIKPGLANRAAGQYEWLRYPKTFSLNAGANTFILGHGNEGVRIDKIMIATDSSLNPDIPSSIVNDVPSAPLYKGTKMSIRNILSKEVNFEVALDHLGDFELEVRSISGQKIWSYKKTQAKAGIYQVTWNQEHPCPSGIYFAEFKNEDKRFISKFTFIR